MKDHEGCNCQQHHVLLYGTNPNGSDGVAWISAKTADAVFGTKEDPESGLVRQVREFEKIKWKVIGACAVITPVGGFVGAWLMKLLTVH